MRRAVVTFICVLILCVGVALATTGGGSSRPAPEVAARATIPTTTTIDPVAASQLTGDLTAIAREQVADYIAAVERDELAAFVASIPPPAPSFVAPEPVSPQVTSSVGGACGGATNGADQFIARESGGDPNALNPSGAYGCYQIMPGTWAGAGCDDLGAYGSASPAAQAACASRLSLSAWNL